MGKTWLIIAVITVSFRGISSWKSLCGNSEPKLVDSTDGGTGSIKYPSEGENAGSWIVRVNQDAEFNVYINVTDFHLDGHFLVIKEEDSNMTSSRSDIQFVSGSSSRDGFKFKIPMTKSFYVEVCRETPEHLQPDQPVQFIVNYSRDVPVFDDPLPDEHPDKQKERESHEVQFSGRPTEAFRDEAFLLRFKEAVARIARDYCSRHNITFDESRTPNEMVTVYVVHACPPEWYDRYLCASVHHSVYASGDDIRVTKHIWNYELTRQHVKEMWEEPGVNRFLEDLHLTIYELPDSTAVFGWWFLVSFVPVALIVLLSFAVHNICKYFSQDMISNQSITTDPVMMSHGSESRRKSKLRLNEHQVVPPFMLEEYNRTTTSYGQEKQGEEQREQKDYYAALLFPRCRFE